MSGSPVGEVRRSAHFGRCVCVEFLSLEGASPMVTFEHEPRAEWGEGNRNQCTLSAWRELEAR